ncbi:MAG: hypothetical protein JSV91_04900, partial [Phycisphaerales bacterium]
MRRSTSESDIALYEARADFPFAGAQTAAAGSGRGESIWELVNDRLSGRWQWAAAIAVGLGVTLGLFGYFSAHPVYRSDGAIRITPRLPVILGETPEHRVDFFSQFVTTQVQLIRSRRVLEHALEDPQLAALPFARGHTALEAIQEELIIESDRNSELIGVSFEHPDPEVSQAVVNSVIHSYFDIYGKAEGAEVGRTLETLYEHQDQLNRDMRAIRQDLARIRTRHETADLRELQTLKLAKVQALEEQIAAAEFVLVSKEEAGLTGEGDPDTLAGPSPQQLEQLDPKLADLRRMRDDAETEFRLVEDRYMPGTPRYRQAQRRLEMAQKLFEEQYAKALELWQQYGVAALTADRTVEDMGSYYFSFSVPRLRDEIADLMAEAGVIRESLQQIIVDLQTLDDKEYDKGRIQAELDHTTGRIQQLELNEASIVKRISIAQEGFRPRKPYDDPRRKRAILGFGFGCLLSFGGFFLLGTVDRRTYGTRQLAQSLGDDISGCLGVLPDLGQSIDSPESGEVAAHCVHQIRNQIEAIRDPRQGFVLAVSSPFQGDGKTSIVMALGWSYAAAGYNTLLIDCDMVGRSLSRQLGQLEREGLKEVL